ncbi:MAG TPA: hypothetical protein VIL86_06145 [Tepidisphaeraceae bacterium]|jgi:hypothetical protein
MTFSPVFAAWLIALLAAALLALLAQGSIVLSRKNVPARWIAYLAILRVIAVAVLVLCLLRPALCYTRDVQRWGDVLVLLDTSRSMGDTGSAESSRLQRSIASMRSSGLLAALEKSAVVHFYAFDGDARPVAPADLNNLKAVGDSTNLADSLDTAWTMYQQGGQGVSGLPSGTSVPATLVVVSDGNDRGPRSALDTARELGRPVFTLAPPDVVDAIPASNVAIAMVQSPRHVLLGSEYRLRATIRREGTITGPLTITLTEADQPVVTQELTFDGNELEKQVTMAYRPTVAGVKQFAIKVSSTDMKISARPFELPVDVVGRNNQVLVLDDAWRWEFKYLRRVLEDDPNFSFGAFLPRGSGIRMQFSEPDQSAKLASFPQSRAELEWFDIIMLGDVKPQRWPAGLAAAIHHMVTERGKSLVVIAGPNLAHLAEIPELDSLLPVELTAESNKPVAGAIVVQPTAEAASSPLFYAPGGGEAVNWAELPTMDQIYPPLRKRPAATILLEAAEQKNAFGNLIVLAEQPVGRGRVLFVGTDTLWKWQTLGRLSESGNTPYKIFWQQALRALAPNRWVGGASNLWLQPDKTKYTAGQMVHLRAELDSDRGGEHTELAANVTLPDGKELPLMLTADSDQPNVFRADFQAAAPGRYQIAASSLADKKATADTATSIDVDPAPDELAHKANDIAFLDRLASATGGHRINPADRSTWPALDSGHPVTFQQAHTMDLWGNFYLVLLLLAVLALDWLCRLLRGFV